jgi:ribosome-associated protein
LRERAGVLASRPLRAQIEDPGPTDPQPRRSVIDNLKTMRAVAHAALEKKGEQLAILDLEGKASYCDWFILVNGTNTRHVSAIAQGIVQSLKENLGQVPMGVEGMESGRWVLLDYGSGLVHVFLEPLRGYYDLDGLWMDATRVDVDGAAPEPSRLHSAQQLP